MKIIKYKNMIGLIILFGCITNPLNGMQTIKNVCQNICSFGQNLLSSKNTYKPQPEDTPKESIASPDIHKESIASNEYQIFGQEAHTTFGLPGVYEPIKNYTCLPEQDLGKNDGFYWKPTNTIYLNEKLLNRHPYGLKKRTVFHETVHKKYQDGKPYNSSTLKKTIKFSLAVLPFLNNNSLKNLSDLIPFLKKTYILAVPFYIYVITNWVLESKDHSFNYERRADTQAYNALQCWKCVNDNILYDWLSLENEYFESLKKNYLRNLLEWKKSKNTNLKNTNLEDKNYHWKKDYIATLKKGYLPQQDYIKIRDNFKSQNKLCSHHRLSLSDTESTV